MNELTVKYQKALEPLKIKSDVINNGLAKVFDNSISYINKHYSGESKNTKTGAIYVVKEIYLLNTDLSNEKIYEIIDEFIIYNKGYQNYLDTLAMISNQLSADLSFYNIFIKKYYKIKPE